MWKPPSPFPLPHEGEVNDGWVLAFTGEVPGTGGYLRDVLLSTAGGTEWVGEYGSVQELPDDEKTGDEEDDEGYRQPAEILSR